MSHKPTLQDLIEKAGKGTTATAIMQGKLQPSKRDSIIRFMKDIGGIIPREGDSSQPEAEPVTEIIQSGQTYIVSIYYPDSRLRYLTLMQNGKVLVTRAENKDPNWKQMREQGLGEITDLTPFFGQTLATASMPAPVRQHPDRRMRKKNKPKRPTRGKRESDIYYIDPILRDYIKDKSEFLTAEVFRPGKARISSPIENLEDLREILPSGFKLPEDNSYNVSLLETTDFLRRHKIAILRSRKNRVHQLNEDDRVRETIARYFNHVGIHSSKRIPNDEDPVNLENAVKYFSNLDNGLHAYRFFANQSNTISGITPDEMIDVLRDYIRVFTRSYLSKTSESLEEAVDSETPTLKETPRQRLDRSLVTWIAIAKAAYFVQHKDWIQSEIVPMFDNAKQEEITTEEGQNESISDRTYEGFRRLAVKFLDPKYGLESREVFFIVRGLWAHDLLPKNKTSKNEQVSEAGDSFRRAVKGAETRFAYPLTHLIERINTYHPALIHSFETLLQRGQIDPTTKLQHSRDYFKLGSQVYYALSDSEKALFTRKRSNESFAPLIDEETGRQGSSMRWILELWAGVNRDYLQKQIDTYHARKK